MEKAENLSTGELQEIVLLAGSKKGFRLYLGLDAEQAEKIWRDHNLLTPVAFLAGRSNEQLMQLVGERGTTGAARRLGVSESSIRAELRKRSPGRSRNDGQLSRAWLEELLERLGSIALVARITGHTEAEIRHQAKGLNVDLSKHIAYSGSDFSSGKGRRAELDFIKLRGENALEDMNVKGPGAPFDVRDAVLGRVNVKSSRAHRWIGQKRVREEGRHFWMVSLAGREECDTVAIMCYDLNGRELVGWTTRRASELPPTHTMSVSRRSLTQV